MVEGVNLEALEAAIERLAEALAALGKEPSNTLYRDAVIQRFEFTYELTHKVLRRYLSQTAADPESVARMSFQELIRTGSDRGVLGTDWERWRDWRQSRAMTSHVYDERMAHKVLSVIPDFLIEAQHLCGRLQEASRS